MKRRPLAMKIVGVALALATLAPRARAEDNATLDLEWEPVPEAAGYEVELVPTAGGPALKFQTEQSAISQSVPAGTYRLRIRSKESSSGVFGAWSDPTEVDLTARQIEPVAPVDEAVLMTDDSNLLSVEFQWKPAAGVKFYTLRVWPDDEAKAKEFRTKKTSLRVKLSGLRRYKWYVSFETDQVSYAAKQKARSFIVQGPELERPVINRIDLPAVTEISWSVPKDAEVYAAVLMRRDLDESEWQEYKKLPDSKSTSWKFEKLPPGVYLATVTARSTFRAAAESHSVQFVVKPTLEELTRAMSRAIPR